MTRSISLIEILRKIDRVYEISNKPETRLILSLPTFKKILMLYPEEGPVISCERNIKEKYKALKEFGILNPNGSVNYDEFTRWVTV